MGGKTVVSVILWNTDYPLCPSPLSGLSGLLVTPYIQDRFPQRLPFSLAIQKTVGQTLNKAVIDLSKTEKAPGSTFVAISRIQCFEDCLI